MTGKAPDLPNFFSRTMGFDLPFSLGDPFLSEVDAWLLAHGRNMGAFSP
jgi:hypothetical protein